VVISPLNEAENRIGCPGDGIDRYQNTEKKRKKVKIKISWLVFVGTDEPFRPRDVAAKAAAETLGVGSVQREPAHPYWCGGPQVEKCVRDLEILDTPAHRVGVRTRNPYCGNYYLVTTNGISLKKGERVLSSDFEAVALHDLKIPEGNFIMDLASGDLEWGWPTGLYPIVSRRNS